MIVVRYGRRPAMMKPADDGGDGGGGIAETLNIDDADGGDDTLDGSEDRGDEVEPQLDAETLNRVAEGGSDDDDDGDDTQAGADGGDKGGKKGSTHVPIGRFNEVNEEKKRLERENAELRQRAAPPATPAPTQPPKPKFDEDAAEKEYATLLAEGEFDKAVAKRKEINAHLRESAREEAENNVRASLTQRETVQTLTQVAEQAVKDYPYLDTKDGEATMDLILAARDGFASKGMPLPEALKKAVEQIAPKFDPRGAKAAGGKPGDDAPPGKDSTTKLDGKDTRSQQANARGAADATKQPPRLDGGAGNRTKGQTVNVEDMTDEQFDALPEAEKRRLRGDEG